MVTYKKIRKDLENNHIHNKEIHILKETGNFLKYIYIYLLKYNMRLSVSVAFDNFVISFN